LVFLIHTIVLYILIFRFLDSNLEDKRFCAVNRVLIVLIIDFHEAVRLLRAMNLIFKTVSFTVFALWPWVLSILAPLGEFVNSKYESRLSLYPVMSHALVSTI